MRTAEFISPFEGMASAKVSIVIGGPLDLEGGPAMRLFDGDPDRAARFKTAVVDGIARRLASCGITIEEEAEDEVAVRVYGRSEESPKCASRSVFLLELDIFNSQLGDGDLEYHRARRVMGLAFDEFVEREILAAIAQVLDDELQGCAVAAAPDHPPK